MGREHPIKNESFSTQESKFRLPRFGNWLQLALAINEIKPWGDLDKKRMRLKTQKLLSRLKLNIDPDTRIIDIKVGQQQVVEIAKALLTESEVIIMDEPTSAISDTEVKILFDIINDLRKANKAIVYISHKLDELFKIADRYVIMINSNRYTRFIIY